eukprot:CAMPEP_0184679974 /NCGR_PEP_ID=MMETSP0312-20130426/2843_1 /TAXON_ID=31354 /ORGANISM="Compsopogon coeruleus, Strain SAG 36.94" /LENGTH=422 /DNA_ID=CAMNT_0027129775 /DNA_START=1943 /DNA_END=3212 /DNA_ORIENTATION=-
MGAHSIMVDIEFRTRIDEDRLRGAHGVRISVPETLGRKGLCELVNELVTVDEVKDRVTFDFVVEGRLLRTTLQKLCQRIDWSRERVLLVEYILPTPPPSSRDVQQICSDWISSLDLTSSNGWMVGCYDGGVRAVSTDLGAICEVLLPSAVKDVKALATNDGEHYTIAGTAKGELYFLAQEGLGIVDHISIDEGSINSIALIDVPTWKLACGTWSGNIRVVERTADQDDLNSGTKLKRKKLQRIATDVAFSLEGHSSCVTRLVTSSSNARLISSSWDSSVRLWDTEMSKLISALPTLKPATDVSVVEPSLEQHTTMATSCTDGCIRLLDPRSSSSASIEAPSWVHTKLVSHGSSGIRPRWDYSVAAWTEWCIYGTYVQRQCLYFRKKKPMDPEARFYASREGIPKEDLLVAARTVDSVASLES